MGQNDFRNCLCNIKPKFDTSPNPPRFKTGVFSLPHIITSELCFKTVKAYKSNKL